MREKRFLIQHLKACGIADQEQSLCADWLIQEMSCDTALSLPLLAENIDDVTVCDVISAMLRQNEGMPTPSPPMNDGNLTPTMQQSPNGQAEKKPT